MKHDVKPIVGFEGFYEISSCGKVFSVERVVVKNNGILHKIQKRELKQVTKKTGYNFVHLRKPGLSKVFSVHRLLMIAFVDNPENKEAVNHIDGNRKNNDISNLEWCTKSENAIHAYRVLKVKHSQTGVIGKLHHRAKKVIATNPKTNEKLIFDALMDAQRAGYKATEISACCNGKQKTHYGMKWQYA
jgi:hypothetical protein